MDYASQLAMTLPEVILAVGSIVLMLVAAWGGPASTKAVSWAAVAVLAGALIAQYQGFADIGMGIGMIVVGLASVILGQGIFGHRTVVVATFAVVLGSVLYRLVITVALQAGLNPSDMKLISAVLVVVALVLPQMAVFKRWKRRRTLKAAQEVQADVGSSTEHPVTASIATTSAG